MIKLSEKERSTRTDQPTSKQGWISELILQQNESVAGNSYIKYVVILLQSCTWKNIKNISIFLKITAKKSASPFLCGHSVCVCVFILCDARDINIKVTTPLEKLEICGNLTAIGVARLVHVQPPGRRKKNGGCIGVNCKCTLQAEQEVPFLAGGGKLEGRSG